MRKINLLIMVITITALGATQTMAAPWYVIRDKFGQTEVTDNNPGIGWSSVHGPFATADEAKRSSNLGTNPNPTAKPILPITRPGLITSVPEDNYFVVADRFGQTRVVDDRPGYGWRVVQGPFDSYDRAARADNLDPSYNLRPNTPITMANSFYPGYERPWSVVRDDFGQTVVSNEGSELGWHQVEGLYFTKEAAVRASGTGTDPNPTSKPVLPITRAKVSVADASFDQ